MKHPRTREHKVERRQTRYKEQIHYRGLWGVGLKCGRNFIGIKKKKKKKKKG